MILVESSVLIDFLRGRKTAAVLRLRQIEVDGTPFGIPIPCFQEVLQGACNEGEWRRLERNLGAQVLVEAADLREAHRSAARIFFDLRRRGLTVRSSVDCLVAQIALERDDVLLHDDADFDVIAKVRPLRTIRA